MIIYSEKVIEHFMCPQNAHSMLDADAEGSFGDPHCGDYLTVYIKVSDGYIEDISYLVFGCCASIATSSMTSVLAKGKSLDEAIKITEEDIIEALDGLPEHKVHCSNLGVSALRNAIKNYLYKNRTEDSYENSNTCR
jgi:nitrogen fixation NifU-like protein